MTNRKIHFPGWFTVEVSQCSQKWWRHHQSQDFWYLPDPSEVITRKKVGRWKQPLCWFNPALPYYLLEWNARISKLTSIMYAYWEQNVSIYYNSILDFINVILCMAFLLAVIHCVFSYLFILQFSCLSAIDCHIWPNVIRLISCPKQIILNVRLLFCIYCFIFFYIYSYCRNSLLSSTVVVSKDFV